MDREESTRGNGTVPAKESLRSLPSVDRVLGHRIVAELGASLPHSLLAAAAREEIEATRQMLRGGEQASTHPDDVAARTARRAIGMTSGSLRAVINATGVVIHTNLGRAPLSAEAAEAMQRAAAYSNLEYDLDLGERGSRYVHASGILSRVTGCEDALVVNNNAAALVLTLSTLASGKEVILSRGQSVEIGGGFRIPDVMRQSGARLVEVGTTNRTYVRDYASAITEESAAVMRVHASNFRIVGFTTAPSVEELAELAHERGLLMIDDVGSGALLDTTRFGLAPEPMVQASIAAGADLVLFSGDKLLGGPQCGIIAGKRESIGQLRRHPLARALRVDKLTLAALEATLLHYLKEEATERVPVWRMISASAESLRTRADAWVASLSEEGVPCEVLPGQSAIGGGSLPGETLPTWLVCVRGPASERSVDAGRLAIRLREAAIPVIGRVEEGALLLDPRTVLDGQGELVVAQVAEAYKSLGA